jgi:predicted RNA-binding protein YlqC (UPF0109 family)
MRSQPLVEFVELVARALVDQPDQVRVKQAKNERNARIELSVAREDIGKVIGKDGRTAQSIRVLLNAAASKMGLGRAYLDILD